MYISAKKKYSSITIVCIIFFVSAFVFAKKKYTDSDFGDLFYQRASKAIEKLDEMKPLFEIATGVCNTDTKFMQAIVFPEMMRYNIIKDGIEAESLRTLYVELGEEYADFSIGFFQMKPSFALQVENMTHNLGSKDLIIELQLEYLTKDEKTIRRQRVDRLQDPHWQLVYLAGFISICNQIYKDKYFDNDLQKLQWYATVYNTGFNKPDHLIAEKMKQDNLYLLQQMPGKKFKYAAIAGWFYSTKGH